MYRKSLISSEFIFWAGIHHKETIFEGTLNISFLRKFFEYQPLYNFWGKLVCNLHLFYKLILKHMFHDALDK